MAFAFTVSPPAVQHIDGRKHVTVTVTADDVGGDDLAAVPVPLFFTLTLFEVEITTPAGATSVTPELYLATAPTPADLQDTLAEVTLTDGAAAYVRNPADVRVTAPGRMLYLRCQPDAQATRITTRFTWVEGH